MAENPDPFASPEFKEWAQHVMDDVVPMIEDSSLTLSLMPKGAVDIKFAVELGLSIMMEKPIILLVEPGAKVPEKLVGLAEAIVAVRLDNPEAGVRVQAAIDEVTQRIELRDAVRRTNEGTS